MPTESYRYYRLDGVGHPRDAGWFDADSGEDALARIEATHPASTCEIWQGKRFVAKLSAQRLRA